MDLRMPGRAVGNLTYIYMHGPAWSLLHLEKVRAGTLSMVRAAEENTG